MDIPSFDSLPTIPAARVLLRALTPDDANDLYAIFGDPDVMRFWSSPPWPSAANAADLIERVTRGAAENQFYQWGIARSECNAVIGTCTLFQVDRRNRRAELGFILRRDAWGQGLMSETLRSLLHFAFETMHLHRLEADVDPRNINCLRLLERIGFVREGLLRERWLVNDEVNDSVMLGLLASEYLSATKASRQ